MDSHSMANAAGRSILGCLIFFFGVGLIVGAVAGGLIVLSWLL